MSSKKTGDTASRYSEICGATNNRGESCKLPAGWGTPGSGGSRCRFHGGASSGPDDTSHLEDNDYAKGNSGGSPSDLNTNSAIHQGFSDWRKAYKRFDEDTREFVDNLIADMRKRVKAPEVAKDRRERLLKERATLSVLFWRASADTVGTPENPVDGARGIVIEEDVEIGGEGHTVHKPNPALEATLQHSARKRQIDRKLRLLPGYQ